MSRFRPGKMVSWTIFGSIGVVIAVLAVANRAPVLLHFDPLPFEAEVPVYLLTLLSVVAGVIIGGAVVWRSQSAWRRRARACERRNAVLEARVEDNKPPLAETSDEGASASGDGS